MSSPLYLVRSTIDRVALSAFANRRGTLDDDLGYALHQALAETFGPAHALRPFRRIAAEHGTRDRLFGYVRNPAALLAHSPLASAAALEAAPPDPFASWQDEGFGAQDVFCAPFEARAMPQAFVPGQRLAFEVLVRPTRRHGPKVRAARREANLSRPENDQLTTGEEHDAYLSVVETLNPKEHEHTRQSVYGAWLAERLGAAATLESLPALLSLRRTRLFRPGHGEPGARGGKRVEHPEALLAGVLRVTEAEAFSRLLAGGVGRHTGFGFGMLLLKPAEG